MSAIVDSIVRVGGISRSGVIGVGQMIAPIVPSTRGKTVTGNQFFGDGGGSGGEPAGGMFTGKSGIGTSGNPRGPGRGGAGMTGISPMTVGPVGQTNPRFGVRSIAAAGGSPGSPQTSPRGPRVGRNSRSSCSSCHRSGRDPQTSTCGSVGTWYT